MEQQKEQLMPLLELLELLLSLTLQADFLKKCSFN
jgi:hypothetical protein